MVKLLCPADTVYTSTVSESIIVTTVTPKGLSVNSKNKRMATFQLDSVHILYTLTPQRLAQQFLALVR